MSADDELFKNLNKVIEEASDTISVEEMSKSLRNIGVILVTFRSFMIEQGGFSPEWAESACRSLWNSFFPNSPMEGP